MIRIEKIEIEDFRGIRRIELLLGRKNFGICGPNGTGKSGIVDAIEFALTGGITRLEGLGTSELSVRAHAPHVDAQQTPKKCLVRITAYAPALKKSITIERRVLTATSPKVDPADAKTKELVGKLATHPEFALSRREIIKYIITPAGQRSKDVQALLRLDQIEKVRQSLQRVANDTKKEAQQAVTEHERAKGDLQKHLGIASLSEIEFIAAVNERRKLLKLDLIADLKPTTSLKEGVTSASDKALVKPKLIKKIAIADIIAFHEHIATATNDVLSQKRVDAITILEDLNAKPEALRSFRRQVLIQQGLELLEEDSCPLCDKTWVMDELQAYLEQKLTGATVAAETLRNLRLAVHSIIDNLLDIERATNKIIELCESGEPKTDARPLVDFAALCANSREFIEKVCVDPSVIEDALSTLTGNTWQPAAAVTTIVGATEKFLNSLPEPSTEDDARDFLIVAQERYDRCCLTNSERENTAKRSELAAKVLEKYGATSNAVLVGIYDAVQNDFTEYYRIINHDDEEKFEGKLRPSIAKLGFDVDFYGRGKFPPGAYHSEGHQDGMGLCLYLALMKHTLKDDFTFAVLDDVLMSVDSGHRREVCRLLKTKFPNTQFILTTHDPVWLQYMKTENLIQSGVSFGGWTVDAGPQVWSEGDVWKQITENLNRNDVPRAAGSLRRYLEYTSTVLADNFGAAVEFHGNGHYDLGDLMLPVVRRWKELIKIAKEAATSWGRSTTDIEAFEAIAKDKIAKSLAEQWMINKAVHYNMWENLGKDEFAVVADAFQDMLKTMQCTNSDCAEFLYVTPHKGTKESLRCSCGATNFNLKIK
jgi:RecF/RecN/SMC N terminal domain